LYAAGSGANVDAASVFDLWNNPQELQQADAKMKELLDGLWLKRKSRIVLRSWEWDGNAWSGGGWEGEDIVITPEGGGGGDGGLPGWGGWPQGTEFPDPNAGTGDGGSGGGGTNTMPKKIPYTASQFKNTGGYVKGSCNCMCMSQKIMKQILGNNANIGSAANVTQLWKEVNKVMTKVGNANNVSNTLNAHINANRPIMAGVNHSPGHTGNNDGTTDHWIVITGRGYDSNMGQFYYNYVETGRYADSGAAATSDSNRLYYDSSSGTFVDNNARDGNKIYTLTQIRPNQ
jgi:hypothetical protein